MQKYMTSKGHSASINGDYFFCDGRGVDLYTKDYNTLIKEVKKSKYQKIYKKLTS